VSRQKGNKGHHIQMAWILFFDGVAKWFSNTELMVSIFKDMITMMMMPRSGERENY
jgi:hypothetical protein